MDFLSLVRFIATGSGVDKRLIQHENRVGRNEL
jgi:hypothetical protein